VSGGRGFGVSAGLDPELAAGLARRCAQLGYRSLWSNDHPAADGLETLAAFAAAAPALELGVGVLPLDRHAPAAIRAGIEARGLDRDRLWVGVGSGHGRRALATMRAALGELREALPGVRLALAAMGPRMCELAGTGYDAALLNWMTPGAATVARGRVEAGARQAGREAPPVLGYVRVAVGADAETRLAREEGFYRELHDGYRRHFARLGAAPASVGVQAERPEGVREALRAYSALDELIVRGLAAPRPGALERVAAAAAPERGRGQPGGRG
jgi:alkanesulfonate monooxygenase SsuD/methylene tetrahydromethanopterin reductase-like flavin-dependent oxidoreductase (luciferase family)